MAEESKSLIPAEIAGTIQKHDDSMFEKVASASAFLPRIMLMATTSGLVVDKKMAAGDYALVDGDSFIDLGSEFDLLVCNWRPKAMDVSGNEIVSAYDPDSAVFKEIQAKADVKDSGCMFGPEFLVYVKSAKKYASYFMSSKTSRREAPALRKYLTKAATLKSHLIDPPKSKYKWYGPVVTSCSTPFEVPSLESLKVEINKFNNPPVEEREPADEASGTRER